MQPWSWLQSKEAATLLRARPLVKVSRCLEPFHRAPVFPGCRAAHPTLQRVLCDVHRGSGNNSDRGEYRRPWRGPHTAACGDAYQSTPLPWSSVTATSRTLGVGDGATVP